MEMLNSYHNKVQETLALVGIVIFYKSITESVYCWFTNHRKPFSVFIATEVLILNTLSIGDCDFSLLRWRTVRVREIVKINQCIGPTSTRIEFFLYTWWQLSLDILWTDWDINVKPSTNPLQYFFRNENVSPN